MHLQSSNLSPLTMDSFHATSPHFLRKNLPVRQQWLLEVKLVKSQIQQWLWHLHSKMFRWIWCGLPVDLERHPIALKYSTNLYISIIQFIPSLCRVSTTDISLASDSWLFHIDRTPWTQTMHPVGITLNNTLSLATSLAVIFVLVRVFRWMFHILEMKFDQWTANHIAKTLDYFKNTLK